MPKLKPGSVTVDLVDGSIHGDLDHCPQEDLLESAAALLSILDELGDAGDRVWGLSKDFDVGCRLMTTRRRLPIPADIIEAAGLEQDIYSGPVVGSRWQGPPRPITLASSQWSRADYWRQEWWSKLVGSIKDGQVTSDTEGVPDHWKEPECFKRDRERLEAEAKKPKQLAMLQ